MTIRMIAITLSVDVIAIILSMSVARLRQARRNLATDTLDYVRYTHERVGSLEPSAEVTGRVGGQGPVRLTLSTPSDNPLSPH